jgi:hypothetical protein
MLSMYSYIAMIFSDTFKREATEIAIVDINDKIFLNTTNFLSPNENR